MAMHLLDGQIIFRFSLPGFPIAASTDTTKQ
ncbi:Uncharacterised protein [Vibrio cholerae]|nr:Uncharacterised protein [Vibrio cholerae]